MSVNPFINKDLKEMEKILNERVYTLNMLKHGRESKWSLVKGTYLRGQIKIQKVES